MRDKGMQPFDKDEPRQSGDPPSQHKATAVINQQRLFTGCCSLTDKDLKALNCFFISHKHA